MWSGVFFRSITAFEMQITKSSQKVANVDLNTDLHDGKRWQEVTLLTASM